MLVSAGELRHDMRHGSSPFLTARRAIVGLSFFSGVILGGIGLFQMGIFKKIPEPKLPGFDANKVNGSLEAYSMFATPDALLGMASYAATACLANQAPCLGTTRKTPIKSLLTRVYHFATCE